MDRWSHARELFDEHFRPLREAGYELERLPDAPTYWKLQEAELRGHFPPEVFFELYAVRTADEKEKQAQMAAIRGGDPLRDLWHTNVHTDFRRRGIYGHILRGTIAYTRALGFDTITSEHAPSNNAVLVAKLGAGFRLYAMEIDPMAGPSVILRYFHNPEHLAAYELRCGLATLTPRLRAHAFGAFATLKDQINGS